MKVLELFSGTHSVGVVAKELGHNITSLDRDLGAKSNIYNYTSDNHIKSCIMDWDYKIYPVGHFDLITASPVCLWWSQLRLSNLTCTLRSGRWKGKVFTREMFQKDIEDFGIPMVDKIFEILDYFKPKYWWIENPKTGQMKDYISPLIPFVDMDYCKFGFYYRKSTRFWTNMPVVSNICKYECDSTIICPTSGRKRHISTVDGGTAGHKKFYTNKPKNKYERYRIPLDLIRYFILSI